MVFPIIYNRLTTWRSCAKKYLLMLIALLTLNTLILVVTWFVLKDYKGYNHYDEISGIENPLELREDASKHNASVLAWYLFSPFWIIYFATGIVLAFLYDAFRPTEKRRVRCWGYVADTCSIFIIVWSFCLVSYTIFTSKYYQELINNFVITVALRFHREILHMITIKIFLSALMKQTTTSTQP
jgi:hypothetical protein